MGEMLDRNGTDGMDGARGWIQVVDDGLLWLRPSAGLAQFGSAPWGAGLDQKMADLHARYERACLED